MRTSAARNFPGETGTILAVGRWTGMVGGYSSGVLRGDDITMRRQRQEERVTALEVHPLESLSPAWLAGLNRNVAGFAIASDRNVFPVSCLKRDPAAALVHNLKRRLLLRGSHRLQFAIHHGQRVPSAEICDGDELRYGDRFGQPARSQLVQSKEIEIRVAARLLAGIVMEQGIAHALESGELKHRDEIGAQRLVGRPVRAVAELRYLRVVIAVHAKPDARSTNGFLDGLPGTVVVLRDREAAIVPHHPDP